jgi:oligopeptide/dipeptide ABC transporter ATP-binding protein
MAVLYKGQVVEEGPADDIIQQPLHPYTRVLVAATPDLEKPAVFEGLLEEESASGQGCRFAPRCPFRREACGEEVELKEVDGHHAVRCVLY